MKEKMDYREKGITLIALVITIIVLLILAGIGIATLVGDNGLINKAKNAEEETKEKSVIEKVQLMLADYSAEKYTGTKKLLEDYLNEQKEKGEIDEVINNEDGTIIIEIDGYEITIKKEDLNIIKVEKTGGVIPIFEEHITKTNGSKIEPNEERMLEQKAITINITNIEEFGENYTIEIKDSRGNILTKETNVIDNLTGQASYIISKEGIYDIIVTGKKEGKTRTARKSKEIKLAIPTIEESEMFSKANGVIDIVWLDLNNNVISEPMSPASYLGGLTPIKYNGIDWVTADITNNTNDWYKYEEQTGDTESTGTSNWANARTNDSNAYFVWIPRYAYKITYFNNTTNAKAYRKDRTSTTGIIGYSNIEGIIDASSETEKLVADSKPTNVTGTVKNSKYADYIPHPAFEFDGSKAGIWVGKFESSGTASKVTITPNILSLRNIKVSDIFTACQGVKTKYGLTGNSHMMKNTEWGAIAYLAESQYGRNGTEISNNGTNYKTGEGDYKSKVLQSTTGNIYGIYDINGTSWEYVAGYINNSNVSSNGYNTDLLKAVATNRKYADIYKVTTDNQATNYNNSKGMKGDAIYETSTSGSDSTGWNRDVSNFVNLSYPVLLRGR